MIENTHYIFALKADINEGLTTGEVSKSAIFFTKTYMFVIPFKGVNVWDASKSKYPNALEFLEDIRKRMNSLSTDEFENLLIDFLPNERVYRIESLEKFDINTGLLGGIRLKKPGEQLQSINLQPRSLRAEVKNFYSKIK